MLAHRKVAMSRALTALGSLLALVALWAPQLGADARLTYAQEVTAAQAAIAATPGYTLLTHYRAVIVGTLRKYRGQKTPATILAANDNAIMGAILQIGTDAANIVPVVQFHALKGAYNLTQLAGIRAYKELPTFDGVQMMIKTSASGVLPIQFKSNSSDTIGTVTKQIYAGTFITVHAIDTVLIP